MAAAPPQQLGGRGGGEGRGQGQPQATPAQSHVCSCGNCGNCAAAARARRCRVANRQDSAGGRCWTRLAVAVAAGERGRTRRAVWSETGDAP